MRYREVKWFVKYKGPPPKPELSSRVQAPCSYSFPPVGEYSRNPSVSTYQLVVLCGCIRLQWIFFEDSFACFMKGDLWAHLPTPCWVFSRFWQNMSGSRCSALSVHPVSPQVAFLWFLGWKVTAGKCFADVEEVKQKNSRSTKRQQNQWVQNLFWAVGKNVMIGVLHQVESTLQLTEF